jgi:predicted DNA-binding protein with PD1-like motif
MSDMIAVENGSMGRVAYARIAPNEDLVQGVEKLCLAEGFRNAFVRGALGSLVDACLGTIDGKYLRIKGPAVEIVSLAGGCAQATTVPCKPRSPAWWQTPMGMSTADRSWSARTRSA